MCTIIIIIIVIIIIIIIGIWDPIAVEFCHQAGAGTSLPLRFGGKTSVTSGLPIDAVVDIITVQSDATQPFVSSVLFCSVLFCSVLFCSVLFCSAAGLRLPPLLCSALFCCEVLCSARCATAHASRFTSHVSRLARSTALSHTLRVMRTWSWATPLSSQYPSRAAQSRWSYGRHAPRRSTPPRLNLSAAVRKNAPFEPFLATQNDRFTKTGSGQTQVALGKQLKTGEVLFAIRRRAGPTAAARCEIDESFLRWVRANCTEYSLCGYGAHESGGKPLPIQPTSGACVRHRPSWPRINNTPDLYFYDDELCVPYDN